MTVELSIGPTKADEIRNYEKHGIEIFYEDEFWKKVLSKSTNPETSNTFLGRRGSGKTMVLKESMNRLFQDMKNLDEDDFDEHLILPVEVSFTAYIRKYSFPSFGEFKEDHNEIMKELFNGYFHLLIIQNIYNSIKKLDLEPNEDEIDLFDSTISLKKNPYEGLDFIEKLIITLKKNIIPKKVIENVLNNKELGFDKVITFKRGKGRSKIEEKFEFAKAPQYPYFESVLDNLMETYNFNRILFFFDEITGLGHLQRYFFDSLYVFRDNPNINYKVFNYPQFYDYGKTFDPSEDAPITIIDRELWKPKDTEFYQYFRNILEKRLKYYSKINNSVKILDEETLKLMSVCCGGNTRLFLNLFNFMIQKEGAVNNKGLNNIIDNFADIHYIDFLNNNSARVGLNLDKVNEIKDNIIKKVLNRNNSASVQSNLILIYEEEYNNVKEIIELLVYCRILDGLGKKTIDGHKAYRFYLNVAVCAYNNCFSAPKGAKQLYIGLVKGLYKAKVDNYKIGINLAGLSEEFIKGYQRDITDILKNKERAIDIKELDIPLRAYNSLIKESVLRTASEILEIGEEGLKEIRGIGPKFAFTIYTSAEEMIFDRDSIIAPLQS